MPSALTNPSHRKVSPPANCKRSFSPVGWISVSSRRRRRFCDGNSSARIRSRSARCRQTDESICVRGPDFYERPARRRKQAKIHASLTGIQHTRQQTKLFPRPWHRSATDSMRHQPHAGIRDVQIPLPGCPSALNTPRPQRPRCRRR